MRLKALVAVAIAISFPAAALASRHHSPTTKHVHSASKKSHAAKSRHVAAAVQAMPTDRATQIQTALIAKGYMSGTASGTWDATSATAMQKFQADNGWQTKYTPDARALIKLGLSNGDGSAEMASSPAAAPAAVAVR